MLSHNITWEQAEAALRSSEAKLEAGDLAGIIARYDEDIVIRFADLPEIRGGKVVRLESVCNVWEEGRQEAGRYFDVA